MNFCVISGHLGKDVEQLGDNFFVFTVATNENYKNKDGEWVEKTAWHNVNCYNLHKNKIARLKKGVKVIVQGKIVYNEQFTNIVASKIEIIDRPDKKNKPENKDENKDDLPF